MKPVFEKLLGHPDEGFVLKDLRGERLTCPWHLHPEIELILLLEGRGHRIVGDNVAPLAPGDMVFVGAHLPHIYQYDPPGDMPRPIVGPVERGGRRRKPEPVESKSVEAASERRDSLRCVLVQFDAKCWAGLFDLPAMRPVQRLLQRAALGLHVTGRTRDAVEARMLNMLSLRGATRIGAFLEILDLLAHSRSCRTIASPGFAKELNPYEQERVNRVYQFINDNLHEPITLHDAARLVHLSEGAFSRFFRARMGKTFPEFVNELRVGRACRLLAETEWTILEIAVACGYRNLSNFNRQFQRLKQTSPRDFRRRMVADAASRA